MTGMNLTEEPPENLEIGHFSSAEPVQCRIIHWWVQQYCLAAMMEISEFLRSDDDQNRKVELIDIFHFVLSVIQCCGCSYEQMMEILQPEDVEGDDLDSIWRTSESNQNALMHRFADVIDLLPWKHWSKKKEFDINELRNAACLTMKEWVNLANGLIDPNSLYLIYTQKNKINIDRQMSGVYGLGVKDESDNRSIKV